VVGKHYITLSQYDDEVFLDKKLYDVAYKVDFGDSVEGRANLKQLQEKAKQDLINKTIMEDILSSIGQSISGSEIKKEYQNILRDIGSDKEIGSILKYATSISEGDIQEKVYYNLLKDRVSRNVLYNVKMKIIAIKPTDINKQEDWDEAQKKVQEIEAAVRQNPAAFDGFYVANNNGQDAIVQNFGRDYYFKDDLPSEFSDAFFKLVSGGISGILKTDASYYVLKAEDIQGYYKGSFDEFMTEQRQRVRIYSLVR
jgi:parvulin-like peptidyl-prolyl isomerase